MATQEDSFLRIPNLFHLVGAVRPRLVMFGPGLETKTSRVVRSILTDHHMKDLKGVAKFVVTGMLPGQFPGT